MVRRRGALTEVASLQKNINKLFEQLVQVRGSEPMMGLGEWFPSIDVIENDKTVIVTVETPGLSVDDLKVTIEGSKMVVSGEKRQRRPDDAALGFLCLERTFGKFSRSIYVDQAVDHTKARAELTKGVLSVILPKLKDRRGGEIILPIEAIENGKDEAEGEIRRSKIRS